LFYKLHMPLNRSVRTLNCFMKYFKFEILLYITLTNMMNWLVNTFRGWIKWMCYSQYNSKAILQKINANKFCTIKFISQNLFMVMCQYIFIYFYFLFQTRKRIREILLRLRFCLWNKVSTRVICSLQKLYCYWNTIFFFLIYQNNEYSWI
jgi:hypothetical protein